MFHCPGKGRSQMEIMSPEVRSPHPSRRSPRTPASPLRLQFRKIPKSSRLRRWRRSNQLYLSSSRFVHYFHAPTWTPLSAPASKCYRDWVTQFQSALYFVEQWSVGWSAYPGASSRSSGRRRWSGERSEPGGEQPQWRPRACRPERRCQHRLPQQRNHLSSAQAAYATRSVWRTFSCLTIIQRLWNFWTQLHIFKLQIRSCVRQLTFLENFPENAILHENLLCCSASTSAHAACRQPDGCRGAGAADARGRRPGPTGAWPGAWPGAGSANRPPRGARSPAGPRPAPAPAAAPLPWTAAALPRTDAAGRLTFSVQCQCRLTLNGVFVSLRRNQARFEFTGTHITVVVWLGVLLCDSCFVRKLGNHPKLLL